MLLPIVLLLASAGPIQQADKATTAPEQFTAEEQNRAVNNNQDSNRFVNPGQPGPNDRRRRMHQFDEGIIVKNACLADGTCKDVCAEITAYVFSDGENPKLQYVTDCPNLDVPYRTQRARHNLPKNQQQPDLKRRKN